MKRALVAIFGTIVGFLFGGVSGVFVAGNCATSMRFGEQTGYEAGAWVGAFLGAALGCLGGSRLGRKRTEG
jgi:hypothetical protein